MPLPIAQTTVHAQFDHEQPRLFSRPDRLHDALYCVAPVINANRYRTRWKHYQDFAKHVAEAGAILYTVEVAFGDRDFVLTEPDNPRHVQLRTHHELWLKERAINIGVSRLPSDWKYVAWVDPDCIFARHDWADETRHLLQHYPIVQMWSQLHDLSSDGELVARLQSFMDVQLNGPELPPDPSYAGLAPRGKRFGSPGLAWAARREAWNQLGGLIDYAILGAGDWYFAHAVMGMLSSLPTAKQRLDATPPFLKKMLEYENRAKQSLWEERPICGNVGLMKGLCLHYWHGPRVSRKYGERSEILRRHNFDPDLDLKPDWQGLYQLTNRRPAMRREIQAYFAQRNEDQLT